MELLAGFSAISSFAQQKQAADAQAKALAKIKPPVQAQAPTPTPRKPVTDGYGSTLITGPRGLAAGSENVGSSTLLGQ